MLDTSLIIQYFVIGLLVWATTYCFNRIWLMVKSFLSF